MSCYVIWVWSLKNKILILTNKHFNVFFYFLGRSYVVGWGRNPPTQPHHAASSCPDKPAPCGWSELYRKSPNPQTLYGALVSGPDEIDKFHDHREDYIYTDVTLDYNAGFTSALAGLLQLRVKAITWNLDFSNKKFHFEFKKSLSSPRLDHTRKVLRIINICDWNFENYTFFLKFETNC